MTKARMIELLEIEHACMLRASRGECSRKCEDCDLCQSDYELDEMYTLVTEWLKTADFPRKTEVLLL